MFSFNYMPSRQNIFVNNYYYHIYNKSLDLLQPFEEESSSSYFFNLIDYYKYTDITISYSESLRMETGQRKQYMNHLKQSASYKVEIIAYCLMPNHFHLLIKQIVNKGVSKYMSDVLNAFTRFYNIKNKRKGPIFLPQFRSKPIMDEEHLIHVSRYIHLNPYVAGLINNVNQIWSYPLSSAHEYISNNVHLASPNNILDLGYFLGNRTKYKQFVESESEYGKTKALIKYAEKWNK